MICKTYSIQYLFIIHCKYNIFHKEIIVPQVDIRTTNTCKINTCVYYCTIFSIFEKYRNILDFPPKIYMLYSLSNIGKISNGVQSNRCSRQLVYIPLQLIINTHGHAVDQCHISEAMLICSKIYPLLNSIFSLHLNRKTISFLYSYAE